MRSGLRNGLDSLSGVLLETSAVEFLPLAFAAEPRRVKQPVKGLLGLSPALSSRPQCVLRVAQSLLRFGSVWKDGYAEGRQFQAMKKSINR